ncbi:MAG: hypothetical protein QOG10_7162 [Kribbellaceae bacterium]|jgi:hypothetical protein|nr:hypothetical protein [Kribbellaceae bacterium]
MPFERAKHSDGGTTRHPKPWRRCCGSWACATPQAFKRQMLCGPGFVTTFQIGHFGSAFGETAMGSSSIGGLDGHRGEVPDRPIAAQAERFVVEPRNSAQAQTSCRKSRGEFIRRSCRRADSHQRWTRWRSAPRPGGPRPRDQSAIIRPRRGRRVLCGGRGVDQRRQARPSL